MKRNKLAVQILKSTGFHFGYRLSSYRQHRDTQRLGDYPVMLRMLSLMREYVPQLSREDQQAIGEWIRIGMRRSSLVTFAGREDRRQQANEQQHEQRLESLRQFRPLVVCR